MSNFDYYDLMDALVDQPADPSACHIHVASKTAKIASDGWEFSQAIDMEIYTKDNMSVWKTIGTDYWTAEADGVYEEGFDSAYDAQYYLEMVKNAQVFDMDELDWDPDFYIGDTVMTPDGLGKVIEYGDGIRPVSDTYYVRLEEDYMEDSYTNYDLELVAITDVIASNGLSEHKHTKTNNLKKVAAKQLRTVAQYVPDQPYYAIDEDVAARASSELGYSYEEALLVSSWLSSSHSDIMSDSYGTHQRGKQNQQEWESKYPDIAAIWSEELDRYHKSADYKPNLIQEEDGWYFTTYTGLHGPYATKDKAMEMWRHNLDYDFGGRPVESKIAYDEAQAAYEIAEFSRNVDPYGFDDNYNSIEDMVEEILANGGPKHYLQFIEESWDNGDLSDYQCYIADELISKYSKVAEKPYVDSPRVPQIPDSEKQIMYICPLCGTTDFDGEFCNVCGFEAPPEEFMELDMQHKDVNNDGIVDELDNEGSEELDEEVDDEVIDELGLMDEESLEEEYPPEDELFADEEFGEENELLEDEELLEQEEPLEEDEFGEEPELSEFSEDGFGESDEEDTLMNEEEIVEEPEPGPFNSNEENGISSVPMVDSGDNDDVSDDLTDNEMPMLNEDGGDEFGEDEDYLEEFEDNELNSDSEEDKDLEPDEEFEVKKKRSKVAANYYVTVFHEDISPYPFGKTILEVSDEEEAIKSYVDDLSEEYAIPAEEIVVIDVEKTAKVAKKKIALEFGNLSLSEWCELMYDEVGHLSDLSKEDFEYDIYLNGMECESFMLCEENVAQELLYDFIEYLMSQGYEPTTSIAETFKYFGSKTGVYAKKAQSQFNDWFEATKNLVPSHFDGYEVAGQPAWGVSVDNDSAMLYVFESDPGDWYWTVVNNTNEVIEEGYGPYSDPSTLLDDYRGTYTAQRIPKFNPFDEYKRPYFPPSPTPTAGDLVDIKIEKDRDGDFY